MRIITNPAELTREEMDALILIGEILGPVTLDIQGGLRDGDYLEPPTVVATESGRIVRVGRTPGLAT